MSNCTCKNGKIQVRHLDHKMNPYYIEVRNCAACGDGKIVKTFRGKECEGVK